MMQKTPWEELENFAVYNTYFSKSIFCKILRSYSPFICVQIQKKYNDLSHLFGYFIQGLSLKFETAGANN